MPPSIYVFTHSLIPQLQIVFTTYCARHCVTDPLQLGGLQPCPLPLCQLNETKSGKEEQKLYLLIKEWRRESSCSKDTFSPKGGKWGTFKG